MGNIKSILFVCTGNSCRSVMAEGILKKRLRELGKDDIHVYSAGTKATDWFPPMAETTQVMKESGVEIDDFRSKKLTDSMIRNADLILTMERAHKEDIIERVPEAAHKTYVLREFGYSGKTYPEGIDIPDPIGRPIKDYKRCLAILEKEIERIVKIL